MCVIVVVARVPPIKCVPQLGTQAIMEEHDNSGPDASCHIANTPWVITRTCLSSSSWMGDDEGGAFSASGTEVRLGRHVDSGTRVAVKIIHSQSYYQAYRKDHIGLGRLFGSDTSENDYACFHPAFGKLLAEVSILKKVKHENVVQLLDEIMDVRADYQLLVQEYGGSPITHPHLPLPYSLSQSLHLFRQLLSGIHYLHSQRVIHHDIKPENLLLLPPVVRTPAVIDVSSINSTLGTLKICDFGEAEVLSEGQIFAEKTGGTPAYFSPERCSATRVEAKLKAAPLDVWAVGVTLYWIVFGKYLFSAPTRGLLYKIICDYDSAADSNLSSRPISQDRGDDGAQEIRALIKRLLHPNPQERITIQECLNQPLIKQYFA